MRSSRSHLSALSLLPAMSALRLLARSAAPARVCAAPFVAPKVAFTSLASAQSHRSKVAAPSTSAAAAQTSSADKVERPISPHVTIYDFPVPAISSITNRATGVGLSVGVMGVGLVALGGHCDIPAYLECVKTSVPILMPLIKATVAFPIVYHTASGIRHLYWDKTAKGLDLPTVELTSKAIIGGSIVVALGLGFYSLPALD